MTGAGGWPFALYLVTDRGVCRRPLVEVVEECLEAGVRAVQVREKDLSGRELFELASALGRAVAARNGSLVVNDRLDVALAVGAAGVQRTHGSLPVRALRALAPRPFVIGASVHSRDEAVTAEVDGADFVLFGPVYDTPSKREFGPPQGLSALAAVAGAVRCPVIAIGGITPARAREALDAGARGVAAISALLAAEQPGDIVKAFLDVLGRP